jgi:meso-butanediol dehydrogenase/(S,S)-butanediol dehydrogenase/diacetyl reductase
MELTKKVAVVNGGAGGIGEAVVLRLVQDGFLVVVLDKDRTAGRKLISKIQDRGGESSSLGLI